MYVPEAFAEIDQAKLYEFIEQHSFATVVTVHGGKPIASHLPLLLERDEGQRVRLIGHMARANPQWKDADGQEVLVIFHGPHAYVSPTWYETAHAVPTWNYVAVHVAGMFRLDNSQSRRLEIVQRYVDFYETSMDRPWSVGQEDQDFVDGLLEAIVGFRIDIEHIEGKWKLSQNHDVSRRKKVIRALREAGGEDRERIAHLMFQTVNE